jgi:hypothetical protein
MANALDAFKAQREAVESLHARLNDVAGLVSALKQQVDGLALHPELKQTLRDEQAWLVAAADTIREVRRWRDHEMRRLWFSIFWRWVLACAFALVATWSAGAGYAWVTRPYAAELEQRRAQADIGDWIGRRLQDLTPEERREFNRLMKLP